MVTPLKILIVEDRPEDAELVVRALRKSDFEPNWVRVDTESDYRARLNDGFDIILSDAVLPSFSAEAALRILQESLLDIPFIVVTGNLSEEVAVGFIKHGAADYLLKDRLARLGEAARNALQDKQLLIAKRAAERAKEGANRAYRTLSAGNRSLLRSTTEAELVRNICEAGVRASGYRMVWVGYAEHGADKLIRPIAWAGEEDGYLTLTQLTWGGGPEALRPGPKAIQTRSLVVAHNIASDPAYVPWQDEVKRLGYGSALAAPLILDDGSVLGCITFYAEESDAFDAKEMDLLLEMAGDLAYGIQAIRTRASRDTAQVGEREQRQFAEALRDAAAVLSSTLDLDGVLDNTLVTIERVLPHDAKAILLIDGDNAHIVRHGGYTERGYGETIDQLALSTSTTPPFDTMKSSGSGMRIADVRGFPSFGPADTATWIKSSVTVPIRVENKTLGFIRLDSANPDFFNEEQERKLQAFADQAAIAINNAKLFKELEKYSEFLENAVRDRTVDLENFKDRLESIFNNCPDPILLLDEFGNVETANPAFYQLFRMTSDQIHKQYLSHCVTAQYDEIVRYALHEVMVKRKTRRVEVRALRGDGSEFESDMALALIRQGTRMQGAVCILRDITTAKEVERLKDDFVSNVSHELRTPVTSIKLNQSLIERDPARQSVYLERLKRETSRLNDLIENMLRLSRLDQGRVEMNLEPTDLNVIVANYVEDRRPLAQEKSLELVQDLKSGVQQVKADAEQMGQVLSIFLTNAINYTPIGGTITVQTQERTDEKGQWVGFSVSDTGLGISAEEQQRLFERFFRGSVGRSSSAAGTGLGLAIAKKIVTSHSGVISISSEGVPGKGAAFSVWLPLSV